MNSRWPRIRGAERLLFAFLRYGQSHGHEVSVLAPQASAVHGVCREIGVTSIVAEFSPAPRHIKSLRSTLRELRPDIIHGMSIFPVALIRRLRMVPLDRTVAFFSCVSIDPTSSLPVASARFRGLRLWVRNSISRMEAPHLDAIFPASDTIAERLAAVGIKGRIISIPGVVDVDRLTSEAKLPLKLPSGRPRIGYAAFLEKLKGIDDLIAAFAEIAKTHPSATLLLAGDGPERQPLMELAETLGVGDRVHFLGFVDPVAPLLAQLDVFVSPSHSEALSISILEAMAMGLPCVCTDVGGTAEVIHDEDSGLLVPARDPAVMAAAIDRLLAQPELAKQLAENGRALVLTGKYSLDSTLQSVFSEYARASARKGALAES
ncbi:MAG: glycosyltransferase family 4 protein [Coriobacteriia bacterium]|nr:glycosyltransferase family 4 protein [Coriobacteriia bacterium]